jgi:hypothetical protein
MLDFILYITMLSVGKVLAMCTYAHILLFFTEADQDRLQIQSQETKASAAKEKNNAKKRAKMPKMW